MLLMWWGACIVERDDWTRPEIDQAFDYVIDRTRLVALRVAPAVVPDGGSLTLDALVLSPFETAPIRLQACGLDADTVTPIRVTDPSCFSVPELVTDLGVAPATLQAPGFEALSDRASCAFVADQGLPETCRLTFPLLAMVQGTDAEARASEPFDVIVGLPAPVEPLLTEADLSLGVPETAPSGTMVNLDIIWSPKRESAILSAEVTWYVDVGRLERLRVTRLESGPSGWWASNQLRIPSDADGPLRVAVVVDVAIAQVGSVEPFDRRERAWRVETIEVTP
ncbi:MAG: hypothetical protein AAGA48_09975 [Myxococcota bacterium]